MIALASTEEKALIRFLLLREDHGIFDDSNGRHDLEKVLENLTEIDAKEQFGFTFFPPARSPEMEWTVRFLEQLGLIKYWDDNPHVRLETPGREFAEHLRFSEAVEWAVEQWFDKRSHEAS